MAAQEDPSCDLQVLIDSHQTFFLNQKIAASFSSKLKKVIKKEKKSTSSATIGLEIDEFPGGGQAFELVVRFMYNHGEIGISVSNVCLLHCAASFLSIPCLFQQTEEFLEGLFYWTWSEILQSLKSCEPFYSQAESAGLIDKLICSLLAKIAQSSTDFINLSNGGGSFSQQDSSSSSPSSSTAPAKAWWFDDLSTLAPRIVVRFIKNLGAFGAENNSLLLTRFLLHYLKTASSLGNIRYPRAEYSGLADTAVYGVVLMGNTAFSSCRALFGVLRVVSGFGLYRDRRIGLERLIGGLLDQAKLDDLLVPSSNGESEGGVYDVKLVVRLIRVFVQEDGVSVRRLNKVGWLIDKYLAEISPDRNLKVSKFIGVAQSLPDLARDSFDGVYRAIDIYLESHPTLSLEERSRLCRCLNYEKLSLETCKELAKNPRIPPRVAVQALASQQPNIPTNLEGEEGESPRTAESNPRKSMVLYTDTNGEYADDKSTERFSEENQDMRVNIQKMQWRVVELEKLCREMKGQMTKMVRHKGSSSPTLYRSSPRLC